MDAIVSYSILSKKCTCLNQVQLSVLMCVCVLFTNSLCYVINSMFNSS